MHPPTTRQKIGLALAMLLSVTAIPSVLAPTPNGEEGPPMVILVLNSVLGLIGAVAVVLAWRGNRAALRILAATLIISAISSLPAFFVDLPVGLVVAAGAGVVVTIVAVLLMFAPSTPSGPQVSPTLRAE